MTDYKQAIKILKDWIRCQEMGEVIDGKLECVLDRLEALEAAGEPVAAYFKEAESKHKWLSFGGVSLSIVQRKAFADLFPAKPPEPELLPCPCCGCDVVSTLKHFLEGDGWFVICSKSDCGMRTRVFNSPEQAAAIWNRRVK